MLAQPLTFNPFPQYFRNPNLSPRVSLSFHGKISSTASYNCLRLRSLYLSRRKQVCLASADESPGGGDTERKRKIVEHVCLLKAKADLSDEEEKDMLDYLYTTQYQMGGIVAISLGRILDQNCEKYTHAVFMRFQRKEDLTKFYQNPFYSKVLKEHVAPYCHGLVDVDFESEVEDDILPIFRKGEEFNSGVDFVLSIAFVENANGGVVKDAMASFFRMTKEFPSLIVQSTQGLNFNTSSKEYTHAVMIRFRSLEALEIFLSSQEYIHTWRSKFELITQQTLSVHFSVNPVGKEVM